MNYYISAIPEPFHVTPDRDLDTLLHVNNIIGPGLPLPEYLRMFLNPTVAGDYHYR